MCKAYDELRRVCNLSAFNVQGARAKRKVNQHLTEYYFDDGSTLKIRPLKSWGEADFPKGSRILNQGCRLQINV
jgi:hypothetical protein